MKKQTKTVLISLGALALITTIGGAVMMSTGIGSRFQTYINENRKQEEKMTTKEKQVAYLKEHEQEMTEYVKSQNHKITTVRYDWDSVRLVDVGNGTPQGGGKILLIFGYANDSELTNIKLNFAVDKDGIPKIGSIGSDNLEDI